MNDDTDLTQHALPEEELVIDQSNFNDYFFDVRMHKPSRGQVIACYSAVAELVDGRMKEDLIYLLTQVKGGGASAARVMRKLGGATEADSFRVPREMCEDMLDGMTPAEVTAKPYKYQAEFFFYTLPKYIPKDDAHWSTISIRNLDEFVSQVESKDGQKLTVKARIMKGEEADEARDQFQADNPNLVAPKNDDESETIAADTI